MSLFDTLQLVQWYFTFLVLGIIFFPITSKLFSLFIDKGYLFSKVLGMVLLSYLVFVLGITHILPFSFLTLCIVLAVLAGIIFYANNYFKFSVKTIVQSHWKLLLFEEALFFLALCFWTVIRGYAPDIHGLEKFMDFGFVNSILRSTYFPPKDMWLPPFSINYYYFGHLITAVLIKLSAVYPPIGYNLMIATLFAFTFTLSFSIGANMYWYGRTKKNHHDTIDKQEFLAETSKTAEAKKNRLSIAIIFAGLLSAFLVALCGNLHTIYTLFTPYSTETPAPIWSMIFSPQTFPNAYWYPNATRFIYNTIHEFPLYSFVVSDLHGHVISIPIVLTIIALVLHELLNKKLRAYIIILLSFLVAVAYTTNAMDGTIYFLLISMLLLYYTVTIHSHHKTHEHAHEKVRFLTSFRASLKNGVLDIYIFHFSVSFSIFQCAFFILLLFVGFLLFSFPFSLFFKPFVSGIGVLCAPQFLINKGHIGPFIFEPNHCQKSPWWQLVTLYGFFYFWVFSFFAFLSRKNTYAKTDSGILFLILLSTLLIVIPEFIYAKDIYPAHYRANTMFKLVYQAFMMLALSSGYIVLRIIPHIKMYLFTKNSIRGKIGLFSYMIIAGILLVLVGIYPHFAINSYYGDLKQFHGLDGIEYLKTQYPSDYHAILWINKYIKNQPIMLEAQGDSYTDYERISANTGLPTVLGWTVHEWLWRGSYDVPAPRITDVKTLYETPNVSTAQQLIKKYKVKLVYVGDLERKQYPALQEQKFATLGKFIYQNNTTKIYQLYLQ